VLDCGQIGCSASRASVCQGALHAGCRHPASLLQ
jgi:hypothetical protein